jgi:hypothetical protein
MGNLEKKKGRGGKGGKKERRGKILPLLQRKGRANLLPQTINFGQRSWV